MNRPDRSADVSQATGYRSARSTRRTFLKATGVGAAGLALGGFGPGSATAVDNPTPRLGTEGKWIVNEDGERVKLRGFATASLDYLDEHHPYEMMEVLERATDGEKWHPNTIRLPIGEEAVDREGMDYVVDDLLRPAVDLLADRGVYAMIDFHLIRPYVDALDNGQEMVDEGWGDWHELGFEPGISTDELMVDFWSAVAPEFADYDHVLYELFNEPTTPTFWARWGDNGEQLSDPDEDDVTEEEAMEDEWLLWREVAQPWVDLVQEEAPEVPVIIGSPEWTSRTQFAPEHPFEGENLIYASHIYPDNGLPYDSVEREDDGETYELDPFDPQYGEPAEEVPVVCTEFGWDPDDDFEETVEYGTTSTWGEPFFEWIEEDYPNMGWIGWCFDDTWAPTFFDSPEGWANTDWELKDDEEEQGWYIRDLLEETKDDMIVGDGDGTGECGDDEIELAGNCTQDTTGSGLHNDITGDGSTSHDDVTTFFEQVNSDAVQDNPDAFAFDGDADNVGFNDVLALFEKL